MSSFESWEVAVVEAEVMVTSNNDLSSVPLHLQELIELLDLLQAASFPADISAVQ
jgi:hypothetical protein